MAIQIGNNSTGDWLPESRIPLLDAVNTIIACLAVLGNGMVITVMLLRRREFSSFTNRLILHQSVIDSIAGLVFFLHQVVVFDISVSTEGNIHDQLVCCFVYSDFLNWCMNVTSTYNLVAISLERLIATCYPVKHRNALTMTKLKVTVLTVWVIGLLDNLSLLFLFEAHHGHCQVKHIALGWYVFVRTLSLGIEYIVPMTIMIYSYTRILIMLTKKLANPANGQQNVMNRAKKNVLITTLLISIVFAICWAPIQTYNFSDLILNKMEVDSVFYAVSVSLVGCNMFVNPIIYCFRYEHFRSQLKDLVLKRFRGNRVHNGEPVQMIAQ